MNATNSATNGPDLWKRRIIIWVLLPLAVLLTAVVVNGYSVRQQDAQVRRLVAGMDGKLKSENRVPDILATLFGADFHSSFDRTAYTELILFGEKVSDGNLAQIAGLTDLRRLTIERTRVTNAGLVNLGGLRNLEQLSLDHTKVNDLTPISKLPNLVELSLIHTAAGDADLETLAEMPALRAVNLGYLKLSDSGINTLARLTELEGLSLDGIALSDVAMQQLKALTKLQGLSLIQAKVSAAALESFKAAVPGCRIVQ